jgi:hypothetical protein
MTPVEEQFEVLRSYEPGALLQRLPDGSHLITVTCVKLRSGWSKPTVEVKFVAPVGFPFAKPDCFWADPDLRLANGNSPQNTGFNAIPHVPSSHLWFSWHVGAWNPNCDNLLTYWYVIKRRLSAAQ